MAKDSSRNTKDAHQPGPRMLEFLVCPLTHTSLAYDRQANELISRAARLAYPVRNGIPLMLPSEARPLGESELD
ncbi:MAG: Trm112 family protein [Rhizobiaceae bacterium]